jgi:transcriptional regulator with XRE-family HTH domain
MSPEKERNILFGAEIRKLRQLMGFGLREFAEKAGISASYLSLIERGKTPPPVREKIIRIANELEEDETELLELANPLDLDDRYFAYKQGPKIKRFKKLLNYFQTLLYSEDAAPLDLMSVVALYMDQKMREKEKHSTAKAAKYMIGVIKEVAESESDSFPEEIEEARQRGMAFLDLIFSMEDGKPPTEEELMRAAKLYAPFFMNQEDQPSFPELEPPETERDLEEE